MKHKTLFALVLALAVGAFANITGSLKTQGVATGISSAQVGFKGTLYPVASNGSFDIPTTDPTSVKFNPTQARKVLTKEYDVFGRKINLNQTQSWATQISALKQYTTVQAASARSLSSSTDTLYIVVNGDTLREVPVTSWNAVLPTNYIQQRNVQVNVNQAYSYDVVQAVWWNTDSIAHVLNLRSNSLENGSFSGYIYTVYNDSDYRVNDTIYNLFVRTRSHDSITSYTKILPVYAQVGDLVFPATVFQQNTFHTTLGYSLTPNDSSIAVFSTRNIEMVYYHDTTDSIVAYPVTQSDTVTDSGYVHGRTIFQGTQIPGLSISSDTSVNVKMNIVLTGTANKDISTLTLKRSPSPWTWTLVDTLSNLKVGNTFSFKIINDPHAVQFLDNVNVSNLKLTVTYQIIQGHWKNP
jgi:hypothetical protein